MVTQTFLSIVFTIVQGFLNMLPDISWSVDSSAFSYFLDIVRVVGYLMPVQTVSMIIGIIVSLTSFKIIISLLKTVWDILPIV